jgi:hypothetical protein
MAKHIIAAGDQLFLDSLDFEVLPGGATEPVIHWRGIILIIELISSDPAH